MITLFLLIIVLLVALKLIAFFITLPFKIIYAILKAPTFEIILVIVLVLLIASAL